MRLSEKIIFIFWVVVTAMLAVTTFLPNQEEIYSSWWFSALWGVVGICLLIAIVKRKLYRSPSMLLIHGAFVMILLGGWLTSTTSEKGMVNLYPGQVAKLYVSDGGSFKYLPKEIELDSFMVVNRKAISTPADFVSYLKVGGEPAMVSVNHPLSIMGYRLYQSSYGDDGSSVLKLNHDPYGTTISYIGYIILAIGLILSLLAKNGGFRKSLIALKIGAVILLVTIPVRGMAENKAPVSGVSESQAEALSERLVVYNDRVAPFSVAATDLVRKLTGKSTFRGASATQIAASLMLYPEEWVNEPLIRIKSSRLREALNLGDTTYVSASRLYSPAGDYILQTLYSSLDPQSPLAKDIVDVDDRVSLLNSAMEGKFIIPATDDQIASMPKWRIKAEIAYNQIPFAKLFFMVALTCGLLALVSSLWWKGRAKIVFASVALLAVAWQLCGWILRWIIAQRVPLGSGSETLVFLSIVITLAGGLALLKGKTPAPSLALIMGGFAGLVGWLAQRDPVVTPLMPVLSSPWLAIHVSVIMSSYALLSLTFVIALTGMFKPSQRLGDSAMVILYPAVALLCVGIFTGAVWAGEAWGRYWAWDPKETWALITLMVYAMPLHKSTGLQKRPRELFLFLIFAFLTVIMTYWGVNFLPSLHAYS